MSDNVRYVNQGGRDEITASDGIADRTTDPMASGRKIISDRQDSGLTSLLQNSPEVEFGSRWREKAFLQMTQREIEAWFDELLLLIRCETVEN